MRILSVVASFLVMICLGGVYGWSIFVNMLHNQLSFSSSQSQLVIGVTLTTYATSMTFAGKLERKYGPQLLTIIGSLLFIFGYLLTGFWGANFISMVLIFGLLCGVGLGLCYVCCLVVPAKNFPNHKGLAVGFSAAGFGAGAILTNYFVKYFIAINPSIFVLDIFKYLAYFYTIILILSVPFIRYKDKINKKIIIDESKINLLNDKMFFLLFLLMFSGSFAGLLVLSNLKSIVLSLGFIEKISILSITFYSIGNMSGRIIWGIVVDKIGVDKSLIISFLMLAGSILSLSLLSSSEINLYFILVIIGVSYSSFFVLFPTKITQIYGVNNLGLIYPYLFLSYGLAAISGPFLAGYLFDLTNSFTLALFLSITISIVGIGFYLVFRNIFSVNKLESKYEIVKK